MGWVVFWIICGFASAYIAGQKHKSAGLWFFLGLVLGPIAVLMIGFSSANAIPAAEMTSLGLRKCPWCAEDIKTEAIVCKHCGRDVPPLEPSPAAVYSFRCTHCGHMTTTETGKCTTCAADL